MKTERGAVLILVCGVLIGIFAALVQQRPAREKRVDVLVVTALAALPAAAPSPPLAAPAALALPASSLAMLARISHPNYRHETCRADPALQLFNPVGPELDNEFRLLVPPCARPEQRGYDPVACLPDGSRPVDTSLPDGNTTDAICQALVPGWREGYVRSDNQVGFTDPGALVFCAGYKWTPPSDHCMHPLDVLVVGYQLLQRVSALSARTLVYSIELRPRVPWRDAGDLDRYVNLTAWGIPFVERPDGSYFADLAPDGHWSDTLGSTTVLASCPGFCRPYPVDIYMCTAECDCMPTAAPTTTATTTVSATSASPTTTPPICTVKAHGGRSVVRSREYPTVNGTATLFNATFRQSESAKLAASIAIPLLITRPAGCVSSCLDKGVHQCNWNHTYGELGVNGTSFTGRIAPSSYYATQEAGADMLVNVTQLDSTITVYTHRKTCTENTASSTIDCCYASPAGPLTLNVYRAQFVIFFVFEGVTACKLRDWIADMYVVDLHISLMIGYLITIHAHRVARFVDQRVHNPSIPTHLTCVVAFDPVKLQGVPFGLVGWAGQLGDGTTVISGPLNGTCVDCLVRIVLGCRQDVQQLTWSLSTDVAFSDSISVDEIIADTIPVQPACDTIDIVDNVDIGDDSVGTPLESGYAVRVIVPSDTTPCVAPDPLPADDAVALALVVAAGAVELPCAPNAICIDYR
jgi:hypothetical protein